MIKKKLMKTTITVLALALTIGMPVIETKQINADTKTEITNAEKIKSTETSIIYNESNAGWKFENNAWYYYKDGVKQTGWVLDTNNKWYYMANGTGKMCTGWVKSNNKWYFLKGNGEMATGWRYVGGKWYYFSETSGAMRTGWLELDGKWYYLHQDGSMKSKDWLKSNDEWYYFNGNGSMKTEEWLCYKGAWYYFDNLGTMVNDDWIYENNNQYSYGSFGAAYENAYYLDSKGVWIENCTDRKTVHKTKTLVYHGPDESWDNPKEGLKVYIQVIEYKVWADTGEPVGPVYVFAKEWGCQYDQFLGDRDVWGKACLYWVHEDGTPISDEDDYTLYKEDEVHLYGVNWL